MAQDASASRTLASSPACPMVIPALVIAVLVFVVSVVIVIVFVAEVDGGWE